MDIIVPRSAADTGNLRVWLHRIPVSSDTIYAFRVNPDGTKGQAIASANVYGRGEGSSASERFMLLFRPVPGNTHFSLYSGETLRLQAEDLLNNSFEDVALDVLSIE